MVHCMVDGGVLKPMHQVMMVHCIVIDDRDLSSIIVGACCGALHCGWWCFEVTKVL